MTSLSNSSQSTHPAGRVLWEDLLFLSRFHSYYERTSGIFVPCSLYLSLIYLFLSAVPVLKAFRTATTLCIADPTFNDVTRHRVLLPVGTPVQRELLTGQ